VLKSGTPFPTFPGIKNYVLSRTLKESPDKNIELIRKDAVEFIRKFVRMEQPRSLKVSLSTEPSLIV